MEEKEKRTVDLFAEETEKSDDGQDVPGKTEMQWYFKPWAIILAVLCFGPLALLLLWFRPMTSIWLKIGITLLVVGLTTWMTIGAVEYYRVLMEHFRELAEVTASA
ncbi:hypothetical protein ACFL5E_01620 [Candidatus Omnitrophota bacterium]